MMLALSFLMTALYLVTLRCLAEAVRRETPQLWNSLASKNWNMIGSPPIAAKLLLRDPKELDVPLGVASLKLQKKCKGLLRAATVCWLLTFVLAFGLMTVSQYGPTA